MTSKSKMFIDFQKQGDTLEFSFLRMDIKDVKIFSDAINWQLEFETSQPAEKQNTFLIERIHSLQREFKENIYTQNIRLPLIP